MSVNTWVTQPLGWRATGRPNTSDANDRGSIELGRAFLDILEIPASKVAPADAGPLLVRLLHEELARRCPSSMNADLDSPIDRFEQYAHLRAINDLIAFVPDRKQGLTRHAEDLSEACDEFTKGMRGRSTQRLLQAVSRVRQDVQHLQALTGELGEESVLRVDLTVSRPSPRPAYQPATGKPLNSGRQLVAGLSVKWTLRTDRAQDCFSQGAKIAGLRRGMQPHFGVVTMELRPAMLALLGRSSGVIDAIYHPALQQVAQALDAVYGRRRPGRDPRSTFDRLVRQRRVRDLDDFYALVGLG